MGYIQEPKKLKESVKQLYQKYAQENTVIVHRVLLLCHHSLFQQKNDILNKIVIELLSFQT